MAKLNPFRYGDIVEEEYFTDRSGELESLKSDIRSGQNVVIISPRRFGKSSLVQQATSELRSEGILSATLDLFGITSLEHLADAVTAVVYRDLARPLSRAYHEALELLGRIQPQIQVEIGAGEVASITLKPALAKKDVLSALEAALALPGQIADSQGKRVAFVMDEFQNAVMIDKDLPAIMRTVFQRQGKVAHIFMGSQQSLMTTLFTERGQPMYRLAKRVPLGPIPAAEFAPFIEDGFATTGLKISADAVARLLELSEGHPYHTQELASATWNIAVAALEPVSVETVHAAHESVYRAESPLYVSEWEKISAHQRRTLVAVADDPKGQVYSDEYRRRYDLGAASSVQRSIEQLVNRNVIQGTAAGQFQVPDPYFRLWLRRLARQNTVAPTNQQYAK
ncbi:MAG TPA: ATP-binding protein [Candidatus Dormibacteraeota bacterium]